MKRKIVCAFIAVGDSIQLLIGGLHPCCFPLIIKTATIYEQNLKVFDEVAWSLISCVGSWKSSTVLPQWKYVLKGMLKTHLQFDNYYCNSLRIVC